MAEQDSKPTPEEPAQAPDASTSSQFALSTRLLPLALGIIALLIGCFGWGNQPAEPNRQATPTTPSAAQSSTTARPPQSSAALTRVASSLAQAQEGLPTVTPTPAGAQSALVPLPTLTPTLVPSPVATRTIEMNGDATLRLQLQSEAFDSSGQPVTIVLEPRSYVLGGTSLSQSDQWCVQVGPTGLVFDLNFSLHPTTENLYVNGELQLYDGFCGEWGTLGNLLSSAPIEVNIPVGTAAILSPALQVQGSFLGLPNLLDISTGIFLDLTIRNPGPR